MNIARKIVGCLETEGGGSILEVGAGTGVLTGLLFEKQSPTYSLEVDPEAWEYLQELFPEYRERIILGDILNTDLLDRLDPPLYMIGNFPYNISSQIFFRVLDYRQKLRQVVCMIQKEVAQRITAPPGSRTYGILSVLLQAYYRPEVQFTVGPLVFSPPPKVHSAVLRLKRNKTDQLGCDEAMFFRVVKAAFNQRRKTLRNSLKGQFEIQDPGQEIFSMRPEQLNVQSFVELTSRVRPRLSP